MFETECTQDLQERVGSFEPIPKHICAQQTCSKCEDVDDQSVDLNNVESVTMCSGKTS